LRALNDGDATAEEALMSAVYQELRKMARGIASPQRPRLQMNTTSIVHEAYMRLVPEKGARWDNRRHFFGAAANAMRQLLVEKARRRGAKRRGGGQAQLAISENLAQQALDVDVIALGEALDRLSDQHPRKAEVVKLRYFLGFTVKETAQILETSPRTIDTDWNIAKAWLKREIESGNATRGTENGL
jgi:RNA polymerase sigma factor (TIGR02999 family)